MCIVTAIRSNPELLLENKETHQMIAASLIKLLTLKEQVVVDRCIRGGKTMRAVAKDLRISGTRVGQIKAQAIRKLRKSPKLINQLNLR